MPIILKNNVDSTLAQAVNASDTAVIVTSGDGAKFPALSAGDYFYATLVSSQGTREIVKVTSKSVDTLGITRAQEGTTANGFAVGSRVEMRVTAASITDLVDEHDQASEITIADAGGYYTSGTVEGALQEAMTRATIASSTGASLVGYTQGGTGAVTRTVQNRLQDYISVKDFGAVGDGVTDDTAAVQAAIAALPAYGTLDGQGGTYLVGNLWLKANMVMQNFNLQTIATSRTDVSPINIGNDLLTADGDHNSTAGTAAYNASRLRPGIENVTLENVHVFGDRGDQTCFDANGQATRDGGLHGFCIKGFSTNVSIRNCSARYCGTDGILIYRGLHATTVTEDDVCHNNLTIENSLFQWNRRHGGAGDSINGARIVNCQWLDNGQDANGGTTQGDKGATVLAAGVYTQYGNGFDMEGYGRGSRVLNIAFQGCDCLRNVRDGILFYDTVDQDDVRFRERKNIRVIGCHLDYGTDNTNGDYALTFTSTIGNKAKASLYNDIVIADCLFEGLFTFRCADNVMISGLMQQVPGTSSVRAVLDYGTNIRFVGNNTNITSITQSNSSYSADDQFMYASQTWNPGTISAGAVSTTTVAVTGAVYGDLVHLGHTTLNTATNAALILTGFVVFPGDSVQVSMYNPTAVSKTVSSGTLRVRVSKFDAA